MLGCHRNWLSSHFLCESASMSVRRLRTTRRADSKKTFLTLECVFSLHEVKTSGRNQPLEIPECGGLGCRVCAWKWPREKTSSLIDLSLEVK